MLANNTHLKNFVPTFYFVSTLGILALSIVVDKAKWVQLNIVGSKKFFTLTYTMQVT